MDDTGTIQSATVNGGLQAKRMAEEFVQVYQVTLVRIEQHLDDIIVEAGEHYAEGYKPWKEALHELVNGTFLMSKEPTFENIESLEEALRIFSFDSSVRFLNDMCGSIGIETERSWQETFREHVKKLMDSLHSNMAQA